MLSHDVSIPSRLVFDWTVLVAEHCNPKKLPSWYFELWKGHIFSVCVGLDFHPNTIIGSAKFAVLLLQHFVHE